MMTWVIGTGEYALHTNDEGKLAGLRIQPGIADTSMQTIYGSVIKPGEYTHIALSYDNHVMRLFVNGVEKNRGNFNNNFETDIRLFIGSTFSHDGSNCNPFNGTICEVRVWNLCRSQADIMAWKDRCAYGTEPYMIGYWPLLSWPGSPRRGILSALLDHCEYHQHHGIRSPQGTNWVRIPLGYLPTKITRITSPLFYLFGAAQPCKTALLQMNADEPVDYVRWTGAAWYHEEVRMRRGFEMEVDLRFAKEPINSSYTIAIQGGSRVQYPPFGRSNAADHGLTPMKNIIALVLQFGQRGAGLKAIFTHMDTKSTPTQSTLSWAEIDPITTLTLHIKVVYDGTGITFSRILSAPSQRA
jgi:hypothetical protein